MSTGTSCLISCPEDSSRGCPSGVRSSRYGSTVIMVTHNEAIRGMSDHVIRLRDGVVRHDDYNTHKISAAELDW